MAGYLKHIFKKYFQVIWMRSKYAPSVQLAQRQLLHFYQLSHIHSDKINLASAGYKVFSQFEEDGKILFLLAVVGIKNRTFIEIGSDDGLNSNCANLAFNFGWTGLFIDGNERSISRGRYFYNRYPNPFGDKPTFCHALVTRENINPLIEKNGLRGEVDFLSIDIDGNDYWIWDAIEVVSPRIVMIETHIIYGKKNIVVPYDPNYSFPGKHPQYHGASPAAMVRLGAKKGYRLVGANQLGFNFIFLRNDLGQETIPEVSFESILDHLTDKDNERVDPMVFTFPFVTPIE
jgi:hypothetical protein